jgi:hypothetical protein
LGLGKFLKAFVAGTVLGAFNASDTTYYGTLAAIQLQDMDKKTRKLYEVGAAHV